MFSYFLLRSHLFLCRSLWGGCPEIFRQLTIFVALISGGIVGHSPLSVTGRQNPFCCPFRCPIFCHMGYWWASLSRFCIPNLVYSHCACVFFFLASVIWIIPAFLHLQASNLYLPDIPRLTSLSTAHNRLSSTLFDWENLWSQSHRVNLLLLKLCLDMKELAFWRWGTDWGECDRHKVFRPHLSW